jgi:DNA-binding FrmR family transcriptional regulator
MESAQQLAATANALKVAARTVLKHHKLKRHRKDTTTRNYESREGMGQQEACNGGTSCIVRSPRSGRTPR